MVLSVDSLAGLTAGCAVVVSASLLTAWHGWPGGLALFTGLVNLGYGCYSGTLALYFRRRARLPRWTVIILIVANSLWSAHCFAQAWWLSGSAAWSGLGHLLFEGLFVGGLAYLEARLVLPAAT